jgi:4-hydroxy-2-oxoheptanedioate aldolase
MINIMNFTMRPSRVLRRLRAGQVANIFKVNLADPRVCEIAASFGFDAIWTCMEHVPNDMRTVEEQVRAAKMWDCDLMCRVMRGSYSDLIRPLEADATGIMVPHVMSLADAAAVVRQTRFHPLGRRPVDGGNADGLFCNIPFTEYLEQANRERFVILQIEDPEPLDDLEAIAALPGYDVLFFGPGDFSHAIGKPGQFNDPFLLETRRRIAEAARKHGKFAGTVASPANRQEILDLGYRFVGIGADVTGLSAHCANLARACGIETAGGGGQYGQREK